MQPVSEIEKAEITPAFHYKSNLPVMRCFTIQKKNALLTFRVHSAVFYKRVNGILSNLESDRHSDFPEDDFSLIAITDQNYIAVIDRITSVLIVNKINAVKFYI